MTTTTLYNVIQSELIKSGFNEFVDDDGKLVYFDDAHQFIKKIMKYDDDVAEIVDTLFLNVKLDNPVHDQHFKRGFLYRFVNREINRQTIEAFQLELMSTFLSQQDYLNRLYNDIEKYVTKYVKNENITTTLSNQITKEINNQIQKHLDERESTDTSIQDTLQNTNNTQDTSNTNDSNEHSITDSSQSTDSRQAHSELPQNQINLDVDNFTMTSANTNTADRNKQTSLNSVTSDGSSTSTSNTVNEGETTGNVTTTNNANNSGESTQNIEGQRDGTTEQESTNNTESNSVSYHIDELFKTNNIFEFVYDVFDRKCFLQFW